MNKAQRPLSPHLQVYKPQLGSVLSITHRGTGVMLSLGSLVLGLYLVAIAAGPSSFEYFHLFFQSWYGQLALLIWSACLYYHLCNGIRHLFWDAGYGFKLPTAHASSIAVLIGTGLLTGITWLVALAGAGA